MKTRRFTQVDVFSAVPLRGNALAVVHDGTDLTDAQMADFARWTNLSETTYLLPPSDEKADYRLRIFAPGGELPFAGHPTLGSCHAWLAAGGQPRDAGEVVQQCAVGLVRVRREGARLAFAAPPTKVEPADASSLERATAALGLGASQLRGAAWLTSGPSLLALLLDSAASVLALEPDHAALKRLGKVGVFGPHPAGHECDFEARFFAAAVGIEEDPVTGILNATIAHWLTADGRAPARYVVSQGTRVGRAGRVYVRRDDDGTLWIGGDSASLIEGQLCL
jgi:PhzF family phenazine biosynthesis protein